MPSDPLTIMFSVALSMIVLFEFSRYLPWSGTITANVVAAAASAWQIIDDSGATVLFGDKTALAIATGIALANAYMRARKAPVVRDPSESVR